MPERFTPGKLDEISSAIGEIRAYVHEGRHGINNLSQKMDGFEVSSSKRHNALKLELSNQLEKGMDQLERGLDSVRADLAGIASRVAKLEETGHRQEGQISVGKWLLEKWPFGVLFVALSAFIAWANGKFGH
jgi:hypothetical protein